LCSWYTLNFAIGPRSIWVMVSPMAISARMPSAISQCRPIATVS